MWNTGCRQVTNDLDCDVRIRDLEDPLRVIVVRRGVQSADAGDTIFPWCINSEEVSRKAFRVEVYDFSIPGPVIAYVFQNYRDDQVYWLRPRAGRVVWADRRHGGEGPCSYATVRLSGTTAEPMVTVTAVE